MKFLEYLNNAFPDGLKNIKFPNGIVNVGKDQMLQLSVDLENDNIPIRIASLEYTTFNVLQVLFQFYQKVKCDAFLKIMNDPEMAPGYIKIAQDEEKECSFKCKMNFAGLVTKPKLLDELDNCFNPSDTGSGKIVLAYFLDNEFGLLYIESLDGIINEDNSFAKKKAIEASEVATILATGGPIVGDLDEKTGELAKIMAGAAEMKSNAEVSIDGGK